MRPFYDTAQTQERQRRRPVATPFSGYRRRPSVQVSPDRPFGPRYLLRRCQRNSPLKPSNIVGLKFGWTGRRFGWTGHRFGWTNGDSRRCSFRGGGRRSAFLKTAQGLQLFGNMLEQGDTRQRRGAFWQSGAARYSRARSCSVAFRDGRRDNDDLELFGNMLEQGNICQRRGAFSQSGAVRCSSERSCSVAIRDGHCDNDDATFDNFRSYILGEGSGSRVPLVVRERAVARSRFATGTVTMTTRHSTTSALIYWGTCSSHKRI